MIMCASGLRDGNSHAYVNLPVILAGKAGGQIETGQHLVFPEKTPLCQLYVSMLNAFGMTDIKSFGDADKGLLTLKG